MMLDLIMSEEEMGTSHIVYDWEVNEIIEM